MAVVRITMWTVQEERYERPAADPRLSMGIYTHYWHRSIEMFIPAYRLEATEEWWHQHDRLWTWNWWDPVPF